MKRLISTVLLLTLVLTGCGRLFPDEGRDKVSLSEIEKAANGFYVLEGDSCTPVLKPAEFDQTLFNRIFLGEHISFLISKKDLETLPAVNSENALIFKKSSEFNNNIFVVKLETQGYTLGLRLSLTEDGEYGVTDQSIVKGSDAETVLKEVGGINSYRILSLGEELISPEMLDDTGFIKGLKEDAYYRAAFFKGTMESDFIIQADCLALSLVPENLVGKAELNFTENGYAIVNTKDLDPGYYLLLLSDNLSLEGGVFVVA